MRLTRRRAAAVAALTCLSLATPSAAVAQGRPGTAEGRASAVRETGAASSGITAEETRRGLEQLLKQYPPALPQILRLDPSLLGNSAYLQPYPALAAFLAQHPEVGHNPGYFFADYEVSPAQRFRLTPQDRATQMWGDVIEGTIIGSVALAIAMAIVWLIKTLIDYRRWSRLSKVQTDVHTKLLDRFASNQELLAYIETPAGRRFLESAPIAMDSPRAIGAPLGRILWSAQAGAVLTVLGIGILIVASRALEEIAPPLGAFGAVVISLGVGFIVSAGLAYGLTRRLGLLTAPTAPDARG